MCLHKWHCKNKLLKAKRRGGREREGALEEPTGAAVRHDKTGLDYKVHT